MISVGDTIWFRNRKTGQIESAVVIEIGTNESKLFWCNYNGKKVKAPKDQIGRKVVLDPAFLETDSNQQSRTERKLTCSDCRHRRTEKCNSIGSSTPCDDFVQDVSLPLAWQSYDSRGFGTGNKNK